MTALLEDDSKFGFIVMDGNGALFGTLCGNTRDVLHKFTVDLPKKHGMCVLIIMNQLQYHISGVKPHFKRKERSSIGRCPSKNLRKSALFSKICDIYRHSR